MSEAGDERSLGELLVTAGKLSNQQLLSALDAQRQLGGPARKRLGELLVEQGHLTVEELQAILAQQDKQILWCPRCRLQVNVQGTVPGGRYGCQQCGGELEAIPTPRRASASESWEGLSVAGVLADDVSEDVRQAMSDPNRYIGRYVWLEELGRGGMGIVYRCYDPQLHRHVAIKMILNVDQADATDLARFEREARATARIRHPGIVAVHEAGVHQGRPFLVMDFVEGETFEAMLRREQAGDRRIASIIRQVAQALHYAHDEGIVHRDIKPQNIMIDPQSRPHVMDFGLARDSSARQQLTQTGQIMGTPAYMAPEQADGERGIHGPWTDVYALGAMLYRALAGRPPFVAKDQLVLLTQVLMVEPKPLRRLDPAIHRDLETIALKCLEKDPGRRYASAAQVAEELRRFMDGESIVARPPGRIEKLTRLARRNAALSLALTAMALLLAGAVVAVKLQAQQARQEQQAADRKHAQELQRADRIARDQLQEDAARDLEDGVRQVLSQARAGVSLASAADRQKAYDQLISYRQPRTVELLAEELDYLSSRLVAEKRLDTNQGQELTLVCQALGGLGFREGAVDALGRYLEAELSLPKGRRGQLRAVEAGLALCRLGGAQADRVLRKAKHGFGQSEGFWSRVKGEYALTAATTELESETAGGYCDRGEALADKGDLAAAVTDFTRVIDIDPGFFRAWNNRGNVRARQGDLNGAIEDFTRAIEIDPSQSIAWNNRGLALRSKGDLDGALGDYTRALEIDSSYAGAWSNRGRARKFSGDLDGADADYTEALKIDPTMVSALVERGEVRLGQGRTHAAVSDVTRALEIDPKNLAALMLRGLASRQRGDFEGACADYSRVILAAPELSKAWSYRSASRLERGDVEGALADAQRVTEIDPSNAGSWDQLGRVILRQGDFGAALGHFSRAIELSPDSVAALINRGQVLAGKGHLDEALADFNRCLDLEPGYVSAWINRSKVWSAKGDLEAALADCNHAVDLAPDNFSGWAHRGMLRVQLKDFDGAILDAGRAIELNPNDPRGYLTRSTARMFKGDFVGAAGDKHRGEELLRAQQK